MFDSLRDAFRQAVRNFREELHRDEVPEAVDQLVHGMKREATDAKLRLRELEDGIRRAEAGAVRERAEADTCRRREQMAKTIGDEETARIAAEFAVKHERRLRVLDQKAEALRQELELGRGEVEEMIQKIREAEQSRDALAASAGRTQARESVRAGDDLFEELDRMADGLAGADRQAAAEELLNELDRDLYDDVEPSTPPGADLDAKLAELKRRMDRG